jgi:hypothetical protein
MGQISKGSSDGCGTPPHLEPSLGTTGDVMAGRMVACACYKLPKRAEGRVSEDNLVHANMRTTLDGQPQRDLSRCLPGYSSRCPVKNSLAVLQRRPISIIGSFSIRVRSFDIMPIYPQAGDGVKFFCYRNPPHRRRADLWQGQIALLRRRP